MESAISKFYLLCSTFGGRRILSGAPSSLGGQTAVLTADKVHFLSASMAVAEFWMPGVVSSLTFYLLYSQIGPDGRLTGYSHLRSMLSLPACMFLSPFSSSQVLLRDFLPFLVSRKFTVIVAHPLLNPRLFHGGK